MGLMDELKKLPPNSLGGTDKSFIDADTLQDSKGERYRIQGVNAGEVEKVIDGKYKLGTAGGQATTDIISSLASEQGYTNVVPMLDANGQPVRDPFGRVVADLTNDKGQSFRSQLLQAGAFDVNEYTTQQDIAARDIAEARRRRSQLSGDYTENAFDTAARKIEQAELAEGDKTLGFKRTALNEAELAAAKAAGVGHLYSNHNVGVKHFDRNLDNESLNPFSDSWEQGWINVGSAMAGVANLLGEQTGWDAAAQWGEDTVARQEAKLGQYGSTVLDYKDVDGIPSAFEFLGNNIALSLPYMAGTIAGVAGAGVTGGASLSLPVAIYTGDVWNEMEGEKNAAVAIGAGVAQAALDTLGVGLVFKSGVAPKKLLKEGIEELVRRGVTREAAEAQVLKATRKEIANLAGVAQDIAKRQISAKAVGKDLLARAGIGTGGEALTEMGQEAIGYLAATQGSDKHFDWEELNERLVSAAIAGGAIGGALGAPGAVYNAGAWADVAYRNSTEIAHSASQGEIFANQEREQHGRIATIEELAADARARWTTNPGATIKERADSYKEKNKGKPWYKDVFENPAQLWQGSTRNIFTPDLQQKSRSARILADMFGGNLQRVFSGSNFENSKHHRVTVYKNMVSDPKLFYKNAFKNSTKRDISDNLYETLNTAVINGKFDPNAVPEGTKDRAAVIQLGKELNALGDRMYQDQKKHNPELGYINNYLFKYKTLDKGAVAKNQRKFTETLKKEYNLSEQEAKKITDEIVDNPEIADIDEAFSVVKGGIVPASHKKRSLGLSEKKAFTDFMQRDLFANVSHAAKSAARYTAHRDFIGENGGVINKLLDDMQAEGVPEEEVDKVAKQLQDYLDAESGNYKRAQTDAGRRFQRLQKSFMMMTTLAGLPLATISSFVELALTSSALRKDQIFGKQGSLQSTGKEMANFFYRYANKPQKFENKDARGKTSNELLKDLGYYDWDVGAATVTGVTEINSWQQPMYEVFFKAIGLKDFTDTTRAIRASIAGDYMFDKAQTIGEWKLSGKDKTREIQEAEEALRNLGLDVDTFVDISQKQAANLPLTEQEQVFLEEGMREATFNFVNNAVALPQSGNRPLIYQDPRFALFTQFQGFIATFTANHIPKLWGEYVKRGTPAMKYNAFATMASMIMLGFASQHLKDLIKYGDDEDDEFVGANPYLEGPEYVQRGIRASGLLGTGERVLDLFFPIYETRSKNVGDWAWNQVAGESPAIGYAERIARGLGKVAEGDTQKGTHHLLRAVPGLGPFTGFTENLSSLITGGGWKPRGE